MASRRKRVGASSRRSGSRWERPTAPIQALRLVLEKMVPADAPEVEWDGARVHFPWPAPIRPSRRRSLGAWWPCTAEFGPDDGYCLIRVRRRRRLYTGDVAPIVAAVTRINAATVVGGLDFDIARLELASRVGIPLASRAISPAQILAAILAAVDLVARAGAPLRDIAAGVDPSEALAPLGRLRPVAAQPWLSCNPAASRVPLANGRGQC
jgi:hypothetical protein